MTYAHYPNSIYYNIFHMHINYSLSANEIKQERDSRYFDYNIYRTIFWDYMLKSVNYLNRDIILYIRDKTDNLHNINIKNQLQLKLKNASGRNLPVHYLE